MSHDFKSKPNPQCCMSAVHVFERRSGDMSRLQDQHVEGLVSKTCVLRHVNWSDMRPSIKGSHARSGDLRTIYEAQNLVMILLPVQFSPSASSSMTTSLDVGYDVQFVDHAKLNSLTLDCACLGRVRVDRNLDISFHGGVTTAKTRILPFNILKSHFTLHI